DVLVDENGDAVFLRHQPHHLADRSLPVDDDVARALANFFEQRVQARVVEGSREHANRFEAQRMCKRVELPEPEVAGDEEHAFAMTVSQAHTLFPIEIDALENLLRRQSAE